MSDQRPDHDVKTVYVGNLPPETTDVLLTTLFSQFGAVVKCKIITDGTTNDKYAFIEYTDHQTAQMAISTLAGRVFLGKKLKVNWAQPLSLNGSGMSYGVDRSHNNCPIFVGDISDEVTETDLEKAFAKFGDISECRIIRDPFTMKSKHYAFITFASQEAAANAITEMNGYWGIGTKSIRTNWAQRRGLPAGPLYSVQTPSYQEVENLSGPNNSTIFCGNVRKNLTVDFLRNIFSRYGPIVDIRAFPEKGFGFVNFLQKSSAVIVILEMDQVNVNGDTIRVSWGKQHNPVWSTANSNVAGGNFHASQSLAHANYYWPNPQMQAYQNTCALLMQQQNFYQNNAGNAALPNPYDSSYWQNHPVSYPGAAQMQNVQFKQSPSSGS